MTWAEIVVGSVYIALWLTLLVAVVMLIGLGMTEPHWPWWMWGFTFFGVSWLVSLAVVFVWAVRME